MKSVKTLTAREKWIKNKFKRYILAYGSDAAKNGKDHKNRAFGDLIGGHVSTIHGAESRLNRAADQLFDTEK